MLSHTHVSVAVSAVTSMTNTQSGGTYKCRATQLTPAWDRLIPGEPVSLDIEFQNFKHTSWEKWRHRVGRVAIVNSAGETVLDVYAAYAKEDGVSKLMPPAEFGVAHKDLMFSNGAVPAHTVEKWVKQIVANRTVILHGGTHDRSAFRIEENVFARSKIVDTQQVYSYLQFDGTPSLRTTAEVILGLSVQQMGHSPVEDAQTALKLWQEDNSYDRDAALAKIEAERATKMKSAKSASRALRGGANRSWSTRVRVAQQEITEPAIVQQMSQLNVMSGDEFPPLSAPRSKRR